MSGDKVTKAWSHERTADGKEDWITPKAIIDALGGYQAFDLDPCASMTQPWPCARASFTRADNGLLKPWVGRVWLNPPYGRSTSPWLARMAEHGDGIALIFARTETQMFQDYVFARATALWFFRKRLRFHNPDGTLPDADAGAPSVLVSYGGAAMAQLIGQKGLRGHFIRLR